MELLTIGKISGTHHLKGAVKVVSNIENIEMLLNNRIVVELGENNQKNTDSKICFSSSRK